ncbi:MAG: hypothetical protein HUU35_16340 [Armatimonadetes bacterium]|nr:hypothetical protein [Armatimonadota bacterium]
MRDRLEAVVEIARQAGEVLLRHYRKVAGERKGDQSLVTIADRESERLIRSALERRFPGETIIGEEFGRTGLSDERVWFIDPLDGTTNFVHRIPFWCVAIGLLEQGRPVLGVIHQPLLRETFHGAEGVGAWREDETLQPWPGREPFSSTDPIFLPPELAGRRLSFGAAVRVRSLGSAQLHLALVAAGSARAGIWLGDYGWDLVAGAAICRAAGARVARLDGSEADLAVLAGGAPQPWPIVAAAPGTLPLFLDAMATVRK